MHQRVHRQEGRHPRNITKIISEAAAGQARAGRGFDGDYLDVRACDLVREEWKGKASEVGTPTNTGDNLIDSSFSCLLHLFLGLKSDDGLVKHVMV